MSQTPANVLLSYTLEDMDEIIIDDVLEVQNLAVNNDIPNVPSYATLESSLLANASGNSPDSGYGGGSPANGPLLMMEEEPETSYRFRYLKESVKPHGPLKGEHSEGKTPKNSSGPKVRLQLPDAHGDYIVRVWLYEKSKEEGPSPHRLLSSKDKNNIEDEPHEFVVNSKNNYTACFDKLNIVHVVQGEKEYQKCYLRKKAGLAQQFGDKFVEKKLIPSPTDNFDQKSVKEEFKAKDKDICALYFEAFEKRGRDYVYIANAISRPIKNKKSARTNDLKIVRASHVEGSAMGGDTVLIFTEKLVKQIRIVFTDEDGWEAYAIFEEKDIHKQVAVAFKTPPYKDVNIVEPVVVYFHIERTSEVHAQSEPVMFRYLPARTDTLEVPVKRKCADRGPVDAPLEAASVPDAGATLMILDDPMMGDMDVQDELMKELLQYQETVQPLLPGDDLDDVHSSDLIRDNIPHQALEAYQNWYKDSTASIQQGVQVPPSTPKSVGALSLFDRARRLRLSILQNNIKEFKKFLSCDVVNLKISMKTPLHLAIQHERTEMVSLLLSAKANPYALDGIRSNTPVHEAISSSPNSLQILMSSSIKPSAVFNTDGDDPLLFAIRNGKLDAVQLLLQKGFSLDSRNIKDGDSPLHVALQIPEKTRYKMVSLLLKHDASVSRRNGAGQTALDYANSHPQPDSDLIEKLTLRLSEESNDSDDDDDLADKLGSLNLLNSGNGDGEDQETEAGGNSRAPEPYLALDGDVNTSKKVADLTHCAFLKPILAGAQKQSQVLLRQLERKMSPTEAVKTLNDAYALAKGL